MYVPVQKPVEGLGVFSWWHDWYTVWNGAKYLPARKLSSGNAMSWRLNEMEKNWGKTVYLYRYDGSSWRRS
jgi:hypothetical protein